MYYKILRSDLTHNGFVYKEGLNILKEPFFNDDFCGPGGLYFTDHHNMFKWLTLYDPLSINDIYIAEVELLADSQIVKMDDKFKTDKFILKNIQTFSNFLDANLQYLPSFIKNIKKIGWDFILFTSYDINRRLSILSADDCKKAVEYDPTTLEFIDANKQTPELCIKAIKKDPNVIFYIKDLGKILKAIKPANEKIVYISNHISACNILNRSLDTLSGTHDFILIFNNLSPITICLSAPLNRIRSD
jgi:hypothetical protein